MALHLLPLAASFFALICSALSSESVTLSLKLVHRFSEEARAAAPYGVRWPRRGSMAYSETLMRSDIQRQKSRRYQALYPYEGSEAFSLGNDFGWLHYTWIDIGTPNTSFLVALDSGSDLLWVPCNCIRCAPLSGYHDNLEKDLGMYNPSESRTSRHLACSHELCELGHTCPNQKQPCPYNISYYTENTYSSGLLVQDTIYLSSSNGSSIQANVIIGCGRRQGGGYLDGIAPDGLLGLGLGQISVPSFLSRGGFVKNSFSICFKDDDSGRIYFGDLGTSSQKSTPFLPLNGKFVTYIIEIEKICIGHNECIGQNKLQAIFDSGSSFTFVPQDIYNKVSFEFDRQVGASRADFDGYPFEFCYKTSNLEMHDIPSLSLSLAVNKSFLIINPIYHVYEEQGQLAGFCLALQSSPDKIATIGQNFMTGYRLVFDRENLKLGWSQSNCEELENSTRVPLNKQRNPNPNLPENPLPTNEQQSSPEGGRAVAPAMAGKAPTTPNLAFSIYPSFSETVLRFCVVLILAYFTLIP